ncbi:MULTISPECIES: glycosyltransferase [Methylocaldum]|uniref:glycosyltransferase n=1 Tax=Methylocaldum sp. RMAD-M TaxID=2806557 RepID=UPI00197C0F78|nr:glycosyltransferase involved in cell wall biosynthesis [Methylocaldum sp. RMAD-M]MDV3240287.1 glycosyltransferase [Methylocaldum sp.]
MTPPRVCLFIPSFGNGGVGRTFVHLANGFSAHGVPTALIVNQADTVFADRLNPEVEQVALHGQSDLALEKDLLAFLRTNRPAVVMTGQGRDDRIALKVKKKLRDSGIRFFLRVGTSLGARTELKHRFWWSRWLFRRRQQRLFSQSDGIIANSRDAAADLSAFLNIPLERISVLPNPTVAPDLLNFVHKPVDHPWLKPGSPPVVMGAGRLGRAKDFPTLLKAFARLRRDRVCRLMILGQGRQAEKLKSLAAELGVQDDFDLPGFVDNPYAFLARASLFVLSSLWEGCPNVLIEALAVGTPAVATDCPSGPREILAEGRYGRIVAPGDAEALAEAMAATLENPPPSELLREAVRPYTLENSSRAYLESFGLSRP